MRLIDADAMKSYIDCGHLRPPTEVCFSELDVVRMLDRMPTIDAVEVVRCRNCLNAMKMPEVEREYFGYREDALDCGMGYGVVLPDDYCSKGCKADAEVEG